MRNRTLIAWALCAGLPLLAQSKPVATINVPPSWNIGPIHVGWLGQFQFQSNTDPVLSGTSDNFLIRRCRILMGGTIGTNMEWFFDTDSARVGTVGSNVNGTKNMNNMYIQDAQFVWKPSKAFILDTGLISIEMQHNGLTGSGAYFGNDTFAMTDAHLKPLGLQSPASANGGGGSLAGSGFSPLNRDLGLQARGLLNDHLEYHLAMVQGYRNSTNDVNGTANNPPSSSQLVTTPGASISSNNAMRVAGRLQYDVFDNEGAGYSASEVYFGAKKLLEFGIAYDTQDTFHYISADVALDLPVSNGEEVLFQGAYTYYDGGTFCPTLLKQKTWSGQVGYMFRNRLSPILRIESQRLETPGYSKLGTPITAQAAWTTTPSAFNQNQFSIGGAWWMSKTNATLKVFYNYVTPKNMTGNGVVGPAGVNTGFKNYHLITAQLQLVAW